MDALELARFNEFMFGTIYSNTQNWNTSIHVYSVLVVLFVFGLANTLDGMSA